MKLSRYDIILFQKAAIATLFVLVIILSVLIAFEIGTKKPHQEFTVLVDEADFEEVKPFKEEIEMESIDESIEKMLAQENFREMKKNIAVNRANNDHTQTEIKDGQTEDEYRDQLVKNALGEDDYKRYIEDKPTYVEEEIIVPEKEIQVKVEKKVYSGPTNIEYSLEGRDNIYMYVPVYLCQGAATIKLKIEVQSNGDVKRAQIDRESSTLGADCHIKAAIEAAKTARFSKSSKPLQAGTITFHFLEQ